MELVLIGYGKMNRLVEELALAAGDRVIAKVGKSGDWQAWPGGAVAIDFSVGTAVLENLRRALDAGMPVVIGTTGWYKDLDAARRLVESRNGMVVYGANFSPGVNAFFRIVRAAAAAVPREYDVYITETHHRQKRDAPSGTALRLEDILRAAGRPAGEIASVRAGAVPGTHTVGFDAEADTLELTHRARSRRGFAAGALMAARWCRGRRGFHEFSENFEAIAGGQEAR
jgi:4-hydroxy-tetrahydrodipicolinate reductase